jgi:hypothetical protein
MNRDQDVGSQSLADPLPGLRRRLVEEYGDDVAPETIDRVAEHHSESSRAQGSASSFRFSRGAGRVNASATPPEPGFSRAAERLRTTGP